MFKLSNYIIFARWQIVIFEIKYIIEKKKNKFLNYMIKINNKLPAAASPVLRVHRHDRRARHWSQAAGGRAGGTGRRGPILVVLVHGRPVRRRWTFLPSRVMMVVMKIGKLQSRVVRMQQTGATRLLRRHRWAVAGDAARWRRCL